MQGPTKWPRLALTHSVAHIGLGFSICLLHLSRVAGITELFSPFLPGGFLSVICYNQASEPMFLFLCSKYMETRWIIWWILVHIYLKPTNNLKWLYHFIAHLWYQNFHTWSALHSHSSEAQQFQQVWHVPPCAHAWVIPDPFSYVYFPCVYSFFGEAPVQISAMVIFF